MASTRQSFSLGFKLNVIEEVNSGAKQSEVAKKFNISHSQVSRWISHQHEFKRQIIGNGNLSRKRKRDGALPDLEARLYEWFTLMCDKQADVSGPLLMQKARELSQEFYGGDREEVKNSFSNGWLQKFLKRFNIVYMRQQGEGVDALEVEAEKWKEEVLQQILRLYKEDDIFSADETGLYYKATPDGTYGIKTEENSDGNSEKERLTVLVASNMTGSEKLKLLVIGRSQNPVCFENRNNALPVDYKVNSTARINKNLFKEWLTNLDDEMRKKKRHILLLLDHSPAHPKLFNTTNVEVLYLPTNTSTPIQPMDSGIIRCLKAHYRSDLMKELSTRLESGENEDLPSAAESISVMDGILMLTFAWDKVSPISIKNCFDKCLLYKDGSSDEIEIIENNMLSEEFVDCDEYLDCFEDENDEDKICVINDDDEFTTKTPVEALKMLDEVKAVMEKNGLWTLDLKNTRRTLQDFLLNSNKKQS